MHTGILLVAKTSLALAIGWTVVIILLFLARPESIPGDIRIANADKVVHIVSHFVFVVLWNNYLVRSSVFDKKKILLLTAIVSVIFGIAIEIAQEVFTDARHADPADVAANTIGTIGAMITLWVYSKWK